MLADESIILSVGSKLLDCYARYSPNTIIFIIQRVLNRFQDRLVVLVESQQPQYGVNANFSPFVCEAAAEHRKKKCVEFFLGIAIAECSVNVYV